MQTIISGQMKSEPKCSTDKLGNDLNFYRNEYYKRGELIEKLKAEKSNLLRIEKDNNDTNLQRKYKELQHRYKILSMRHERMFIKFTNGGDLQQLEGTAKTVSDIINGVCLYYGVTADEVMGKCRKTEIVRARHILFYIFSEKSLGLNHIGRLIGGRDHSTVIHGRDAIMRKISIGEVNSEEMAMTEKFIGAEI